MSINSTIPSRQHFQSLQLQNDFTQQGYLASGFPFFPYAQSGSMVISAFSPFVMVRRASSHYKQNVEYTSYFQKRAHIGNKTKPFVVQVIITQQFFSITQKNIQPHETAQFYKRPTIVCCQGKISLKNSL